MSLCNFRKQPETADNQECYNENTRNKLFITIIFHNTLQTKRGYLVYTVGTLNIKNFGHLVR
jgi:hypothetical protein